MIDAHLSRGGGSARCSGSFDDGGWSGAERLEDQMETLERRGDLVAADLIARTRQETERLESSVTRC
jgi:hypothetical protein